MLTTAETQRLFEEGVSLVDHLPYAEHLDGIFLNVDGSVGQVWELALPRERRCGGGTA